MKIVVRGTNWIGDAVMTIPALRALREVFPDAELVLHTRPWAEGVFRDAGFIDRLLIFEPAKSSLAGLRRQARAWRAEAFDIAVLFPNSFRAALLSRLGRAGRSFGYHNEGRGFLLTDPVRKPGWKSRRHEIYYYLNLAAEVEKVSFGTCRTVETEPRIDLEVSDERRSAARRILAEAGLDPAKRTVALGVGSTNSMAKRWPAEAYARLSDMLRSELGVNVVLVGAGDELEVSRRVAAAAESKPFVLTGRTTLAEAVAVLAESDLLVSNDMGLAHVSAAVGTRTLTIFGPTDPSTTRPWNGEIIRRTDVECSPCMLRECPIDHRCMTWISPETVLDQARDLLEGGRTA